ncbi:MAG: hypothetical protein K0U74_13815, partial [Alphaproteobacteria bacterium]|nr:hypothetical protein [Alphaproteobacteria bacterium]
ILFLKRRVDPAGEWRGSIWVIGQAARRTGRPPLGNPKGRADLRQSLRVPSCPWHRHALRRST